NGIREHLKKVSKSIATDEPIHGVAQLYNLGPVRVDRRATYVPQSFHRQIRGVSEGELIRNAIPTAKDLSDVWTEKGVRDQVSKLQRMPEWLTFLREWGYCSPGCEVDVEELLAA